MKKVDKIGNSYEDISQVPFPLLLLASRRESASAARPVPGVVRVGRVHLSTASPAIPGNPEASVGIDISVVAHLCFVVIDGAGAAAVALEAPAPSAASVKAVSAVAPVPVVETERDSSEVPFSASVVVVVVPGLGGLTEVSAISWDAIVVIAAVAPLMAGFGRRPLEYRVRIVKYRSYTVRKMF